MTQNVQTSLGATFATVAAQPATYDQAGFDALTWVLVGEVTTIGEFGATFEDVTHIPLVDGITQHFKGAVDYGELTMAVGYDEDDAGQVLVASGVDGANRDVVYSHRVTLQDGTIFYSIGQLFSNPITVGEASSIVSSNVNVKLSGQTIKVSAP